MSKGYTEHGTNQDDPHEFDETGRCIFCDDVLNVRCPKCGIRHPDAMTCIDARIGGPS